MSTSFDYISAWCDVARPAYDTLPADVRQLFVDTATVAADLHQGPDLAMVWPNEDTIARVPLAAGFRTRFDKIPAEWLALAAQVVHDLGHWHPSDRDIPDGLALPAAERAACKTGAAWKFSRYADQVLRGKLGLAESGDQRYGNGAHVEVHEGAIRLCYSSRDMWTWAEVAPATAAGMERAQVLRSTLIGQLPAKYKQDDTAYAFFEELRQTAQATDWPESWRPFVNIGARYMREEGMRGRPEVRAKQLAEKAAALPGKYEAAIAEHNAKQRAELAGRLWWLTRGVDDENLIYYTHTRRFCFGWRDPVGPELLAAILEHAAEFPWLYEIKVGRCELYPNGAHLKNEES